MYADNVLKGFATSFSVILSCMISSWFMETSGMNPLFIFGAGIVVSSAFVYSLYPAKSVAPSIPDPLQGKIRSNVSDNRLKDRDDDDNDVDIENRDRK